MEGRADMTVGSRLTEFEDKSFRRLHVFGNQLVIRCINLIFGSKVKDVMSGYRGFTASAPRRFQSSRRDSRSRRS